MKNPTMSDNPNSVRIAYYQGKAYSDPDMPVIYLVMGPYALWVTRPAEDVASGFPEIFYMSPMSETSPDVENAFDLDDIESWEGTVWYCPEEDKYEPTRDEMSELKETIRTFTLNAMKWTISN